MSKVFLISVACLLLAACVVNFTDADPRCDRCIRDATILKANLTQEVINKAISEGAAYCNKIQDESIKEDCFRELARAVEQAQYLLKHTPKETCQWAGLCKKGEIRPIEQALKNSKINNSSCDECLAFDGEVKQFSTPDLLNKIIARKTEDCQETSDPIEQQECYKNLAHLKTALKYLMNHTPKETCIFTGACSQSKFFKKHHQLIGKYFKVLPSSLIIGTECEKCLAEATQMKQFLTPDVFKEIIASGIAACEKMKKPDARKECFTYIASLMLSLEYLMSHTVEEYCKFVGDCPQSKLITKPNQLVSKYFKTSLAGSIKQTDCEECLAAASQAKPLLTPEVIDQVVDDAIRKCQQIRDPAKKRQCMQEADFQREALEYLMHHTPEEFCIHFGACPGARTLLNAIMMNKPIMSQ